MLKTALLWPAIGEFVLIAACYVWLGVTRQRAVKSGAVSSTDFAPGGNEPAESAAARRHLANQFELPLLFFAVIGFLYAVSAVSYFEVAVGWCFVIARLLHTIGALRGPLVLRHGAFFIAFVLVTLLWIDLAVRIV